MAPSAVADVPASALHIRFDEKVPILQLPTELGFEELRAWMTEHVPNHLDVIGGRTARLDLGTRSIHLLEFRRLLHHLRENWDIEITGIYVVPDVVNKFAERELRLKLFLHDPAVPGPLTEEAETELVSDEDLEDGDEASVEHEDEESKLDKLTLPNDLEEADLDEEPAPSMTDATHSDGSRRTLSIHRTLRSGNIVRFDGDIYIFGDVNPGAHVAATGNLVVLGALKGMAHAGAAGEEDAIILAHVMQPTQLRIGRKIAVVPDAPEPPKPSRGLFKPKPQAPQFHPELASIVDGQIVIQPYQGRASGK